MISLFSDKSSLLLFILFIRIKFVGVNPVSCLNILRNLYLFSPNFEAVFSSEKWSNKPIESIYSFNNLISFLLSVLVEAYLFISSNKVLKISFSKLMKSFL